MNSHTSSLSSLESGYTFPFLSTNSFFISIIWSHIFFFTILLLAFFLKTWIHLWNLEGTNFLAFPSNFVIFSFFSQISYFLITLFTFIVLLFCGFLHIFFLFLYPTFFILFIIFILFLLF